MLTANRLVKDSKIPELKTNLSLLSMPSAKTHSFFASLMQQIDRQDLRETARSLTELFRFSPRQFRVTNQMKSQSKFSHFLTHRLSINRSTGWTCSMPPTNLMLRVCCGSSQISKTLTSRFKALQYEDFLKLKCKLELSILLKVKSTNWTNLMDKWKCVSTSNLWLTCQARLSVKATYWINGIVMFARLNWIFRMKLPIALVVWLVEWLSLVLRMTLVWQKVNQCNSQRLIPNLSYRARASSSLDLFAWSHSPVF